MADERILRIPRSDVSAGPVLLSVTSNGPQPLDLKLIGTDGVEPFVGSIEHRRVGRLKAAHGSQAEWEAALSRVLLQHKTHDANANFQGLEAVAAEGRDDSDRQLTITLRNSISEKQRLGVITLKHVPDEEIDIFHWTSVAVRAATSVQTDFDSLQLKYDAQQATIDRLNAQLQDLVQAKQDHENALLAKFQELLNSKKLKIRDQQRLLAGAKVDPDAGEALSNHVPLTTLSINEAAAVDSARGSKKVRQVRKAGTSRTSKRKADSATPPVSDSGESVDNDMQIDDGFEGREEDRTTPDHSDLDETEDDDDDDEGFDAVPTSRPTKAGVGSKGKAVESVTAQRKTSPSQQGLDELPPRRELPFVREANASATTKKPEPAPKAQVDDETTDDDEL